MNIVFFGSSQFSIPILKALISSHHKVAAVVATAAKKKGRGQLVLPSVVEALARNESIICLTPDDLNSDKAMTDLSRFSADCFVVAAYGKMIPSRVLAIPKKMPLNIHPSLLPRYRGAAPIAHQLLNGEKLSGVTIARITEKLDAGEIIFQEQLPIDGSDDGITLGSKLSQMGARLIVQILNQIENGQVNMTLQDESKQTYAPKLTKQMGQINWHHSADSLHNQIRALLPWPVACTAIGGKRIKVLSSQVDADVSQKDAAGTIISIDFKKGLGVQTGSGVIWLNMVQPESGKAMDGYSFAMGRKLKAGDYFE